MTSVSPQREDELGFGLGVDRDLGSRDHKQERSLAAVPSISAPVGVVTFTFTLRSAQECVIKFNAARVKRIACEKWSYIASLRCR